MPNPKRLTDQAVKAVAAPSRGETRVWDADLKGFFVRVYASGRKVYAVRRRVADADQVVTIGVHGSPWTAKAARASAERLLTPSVGGPESQSDTAAPITVAALIERYLGEGPRAKPAKRSSTWAIDASNLRRHIRPLLGERLAAEITKAEAADAIAAIIAGRTRADQRTGPRGRARVTGGEGTARRTSSSAAAMYAWAVELGLAPANPFARVRLAAAPARQRFLSAAEARTFLETIDTLEASEEMADGFADALRLLLLTGARKTEVLGLRWSEVDLANALLSLPRERTKAGGRTGERHIALSETAVEILRERRRRAGRGANFVFPAARGSGHMVGLRKPFLQACEAAGLETLRIHDLRHTFASLAITAGEPIFLVGKLLGHASSRTTDRYAHLANAPLRRAVSRIGRQLTARGAESESEMW